jgi:serine/threonine protein kinase
VTSFKALELRKSRLDSQAEENLLSADDCIEGRYDIDTVLGRGPLGQVYKAKDRETGRYAALKAIHPKLYESPSDRAHLLETLDDASRHSATRVLRPQPITHGDVIVCRSMFVTGISLAKVIRQRRARGSAFSVEETFPRIRQLHEAIADLYADKAHGLIKPENIILLPDGLRVTDYGLGQGIALAALVEAQQEAGTSAYLAPEVIKGGERASPLSDMYSMGVLFCEMLTNLPWENDVNLADRLKTVFNRPVQVDRMIDFIEKSTATDPGSRFSSVASFGSALSELIASEAAEAAGPTTSQSMPKSKVLLTVQEMPVYTPAETDADSTQEVQKLDTDFLEDSTPAKDVAVEYVLSGSRDVISDEADFLERVPTKVEATHTGSGVRVSSRTPTGVIKVEADKGLGSNRLFSTLLIMVILLGGGGVWAILSLIESTGSKPEIAISKGETVPSDSAQNTGGDSPAVPVDGATVQATEDTTAHAKTLPSKGAKTEKPTVNKDTNKVQKSVPLVPQKPVIKTTTSKNEVKTPIVAATPVTQVKSPAPKAKAPILVEPKDTPKAIPAPKAKQAPKPKPALKAKSKKEVPVATPKAAEPVEAVDQSGVSLSCPSGMRLLRTKRFPKGSVRKGKISGNKAIELAKSGGAYCVDGYEYPGRSKRPKTNVTRTTAAALCKRASKRLCTGREWRSACTGSGGAVYPYGRSFNANKCVTEDDDGEERSVTTGGKFRRCRSASGAYDMVGNVGEWTVDGRVRGGDVASSDEDASCSASEARSPSYSGGRVGFRCCTDFREE